MARGCSTAVSGTAGGEGALRDRSRLPGLLPCARYTHFAGRGDLRPVRSPHLAVPTDRHPRWALPGRRGRGRTGRRSWARAPALRRPHQALVEADRAGRRLRGGVRVRRQRGPRLLREDEPRCSEQARAEARGFRRGRAALRRARPAALPALWTRGGMGRRLRLAGRSERFPGALPLLAPAQRSTGNPLSSNLDRHRRSRRQGRTAALVQVRRRAPGGAGGAGAHPPPSRDVVGSRRRHDPDEQDRSGRRVACLLHAESQGCDRIVDLGDFLRRPLLERWVAADFAPESSADADE